MKSTFFLYISALFALIGLSSCQTGHLLGYEVYNATNEPVLVGAANLAYHGHELAPGESMELDVFIGPGNVKSAYTSDSLYRLGVEKSVSTIETSNLSALNYRWEYRRQGISRAKSILRIEGTEGPDSKARASR